MEICRFLDGSAPVSPSLKFLIKSVAVLCPKNMLFQNRTCTVFDRLSQNLMRMPIWHSCTALFKLSSKLIEYHSEAAVPHFNISVTWGPSPKLTMYLDFILPSSIWLAFLLSGNITPNNSHGHCSYIGHVLNTIIFRNSVFLRLGMTKEFFA